MTDLDPRVDAPDAPGRPLGLDPLIDYDLRDLNFPMAELLDTEIILPESKYWSPGMPLNQGREGACVGFSGAKNLYCYPIRTSSITEASGTLSGNNLGRGIYYECKKIDGSPDTSGTSLHACAKVLNGASGWKDRVVEYRWAWDWDTAMAWLLTRGVLIIGIPWYRSFDIGSKTTMPYLPMPSGGIRGYHAVCIYGGNRTNQTMRMINSWGYYFGFNGKAIFRRSVLEPILFSELGAGCLALVEQRSLTAGIALESTIAS
jgi:hypothetical protein